MCVLFEKTTPNFSVKVFKVLTQHSLAYDISTVLSFNDIEMQLGRSSLEFVDVGCRTAWCLVGLAYEAGHGLSAQDGDYYCAGTDDEYMG